MPAAPSMGIVSSSIADMFGLFGFFRTGNVHTTHGSHSHLLHQDPVRLGELLQPHEPLDANLLLHRGLGPRLRDHHIYEDRLDKYFEDEVGLS